MSSVVVSFDSGTTIIGENLEVISPQEEENIIKVLPDGDKSGTSVTIIGGGQDDSIDLGVAGDSTALGLDGDDMIMGGMGADLLDGGEGNDTLKGGMGADLLRGGAGEDIFEFVADEFESGAMDIISDFRGGEDSIVIKGVSDNGRVRYDADTGIVSVDGTDAIDIGKDLKDINPTKQDDGSWGIF